MVDQFGDLNCWFFFKRRFILFIFKKSSLTDLNLLQYIIIHINSHPVHIMIGAVVHNGVGEHEHHVVLELCCSSYGAVLNMPFYCTQVFGPV